MEFLGRIRVRVMCENCGYVTCNGTRVYMLPWMLTCLKCAKPNSMCSVVELPNGEMAPTRIIRMEIGGELFPDDD